MVRARVKKNDPDAIIFLGAKCFHGELGLRKDVQRAVELYTEAAELGSIDALLYLGDRYRLGEGVQENKAKAAEYYEKAAMQGHVESRHNLGCIEVNNEKYDRAVRHLLISAKMGHNESVDGMKNMFKVGFVTKEQYAQALKCYQDAVEEMNSNDRDEAKRLGQ